VERPRDDEGALDRCVLALYRAVREDAPAAFPDAALAQIEAVLPFDYAVWSRAALEAGQVRLYGAHQLRLPQGAMEAWRAIEDHDVLGRMAFAKLGRTVIASPARGVTDDPVILEKLIQPFDISHVLTTCLWTPSPGW
jgi:hypothetical protein